MYVIILNRKYNSKSIFKYYSEMKILKNNKFKKY